MSDCQPWVIICIYSHMFIKENKVDNIKRKSKLLRETLQLLMLIFRYILMLNGYDKGLLKFTENIHNL